MKMKIITTGFGLVLLGAGLLLQYPLTTIIGAFVAGLGIFGGDE